MIDWRVRFEAVALAGVEVVGAMSGRRVYEARARFERYVIAEDEDAFSRQERVAIAKVLECRSFEHFDDAVVGPAELRSNCLDELRGDDEVLAVMLDDVVVEVWFERDGEIRRQRPWRRRPDHGVARLLDWEVEALHRFVGQTESHVHRR